MKTINLMKVMFTKSLLILSCLICSNIAIAQPTYNFHPNQKFIGDNSGKISYRSNNKDIANLRFFDKDGSRYGDVYGSKSGGGKRFGLLDGDGQWSYKAEKDNHTAFLINNVEMMRIKANGNVGIGTKNAQYKLDVCGPIRAKEVIVKTGWCDFVFEPAYYLSTLKEEEEFIKRYGHLSNFKSAEDMNGEININDIFKRQQVQIEENVLHLISLNEENETLKMQVSELMANYASLAKEMAEMKAKF